MLKWLFGKKKNEDQSSSGLSVKKYERAKEIASSGTFDEKASLASDPNLEPELLYFFASDDSSSIRRAVATNPASPIHADIVLARDPDQDVRKIVAEKIATALPGLSLESNEHVTTVVFEALDVLARDALPHIRSIVADSIKELKNVPKPLVSMLARDVSDMVAVPVLEYSPVLSTDDLLDLIRASKQDSRLSAISRRSSLPAEIAGAIVDSGSTVATVVLLENESATISDQSLSDITDVAENDEVLHEPLALRPDLPRHILARVSKFVSDTLITQVVDRGRLDADQERALRKRVDERVSAVQLADDTARSASEKVRALKAYEKGELNNAVILTAIKVGKNDFVRCGLCLMAKISESQIRNILTSSNGKFIVAVVWKSGLSMDVAAAIQQHVAKFPSNEVIYPGTNGEFPFSESEMEAMLEEIQSN